MRFIANARDIGFPIGDVRSLLDLWPSAALESMDVKRLALDRAEELHLKLADAEGALPFHQQMSRWNDQHR
ncbi:MAG: MerR family DNA-binding protein [Sphingomonas sp.]